jgi:hypothetical protein
VAIDEDKWTPADLAEINRLKAEGRTEEQAINEVLKERAKLDIDSTERAAKKIEKLKAEEEILQRALATDKERYATSERSRALAEIRLGREEQELELIRQKLISQKELTDEEKEHLEAVGGTLKELDETLNATTALLTAQKKLNSSLGAASPLEKKFTAAAAQALVAIKGKQKWQLAVNKASAIGDGILTSAFTAMIEQIKEADKAFSDFRKNMQLGDKYESRITSTTQSLRAYGVTMENASAAQNALIKTTTDFTMMNGTAQASLVESAAIMAELGVANQDYAQGVQNSMKFANQGWNQAIQTQGELASTARALGLEQGAFAAQYAKMGPSIAKFGDNAVKAFKDLAHISKITGMEMEKLLNMTNKFDTFEGAAEQAGKLNAALGGNMVNAMDLMMATDPAERFGMIRDSILDAGLSFDDMSYYQKNFYKDAMGLSDVGELAQVLSGDMDNLAGASTESAESLIEQKKRAAEAQGVMDTYKNLLADMGTALLPVVQSLTKLTGWLVENKWAVYTLIGAYAAWKAISMIMIVLKLKATMATAANTAAIATNAAAAEAAALANAHKTASETADTAAMGANTVATGADTAATNTNTMANAAGGKAKAKMIPTLLAFGAAILMIGIAVYLATTGIANMAESFAKLPVTHLNAFNSLLIGLAIGLAAVFLALVLGGIALNSSGATLAVMAVAASFMMMAIGVGIAAAGVGLMAQGFTVMFQAVELDKLLALGLFFGILLYGAPLLVAAGWAIAAISIALGAFSIALKLMSFDTLGDITSFMKSFEDFEVASIYAITEALSNMAKTIDEMDMKKTLALEAVLATTAVVGATMGPALMLPMIMAGAVGGGVTAAMKANQTPAGGSQGTKIQAPLVIKLGDTGEKLKEFIIEVVGEEVKVANA